jgi:orotate phosphoribosyltransferase
LTEAIAKSLLAIDAVGFSPDAPVVFKSGIQSPVYVDNRRLPFHPDHWQTVITGFVAMIEAHAIEFDAIAGVEAAGIPHSAALGYAMNRPSIFVRKEPKEHGKGKQVEGGDVNGLRVLLVEDLVTTGGSSLKAVDVLRHEGAIVTDCMSIVTYGFEEATLAFEKSKVRHHVLVSFPVIIRIAEEQGNLASAAVQIIQDWFRDPHGWASRHGFGGTE